MVQEWSLVQQFHDRIKAVFNQLRQKELSTGDYFVMMPLHLHFEESAVCVVALRNHQNFLGGTTDVLAPRGK